MLVARYELFGGAFWYGTTPHENTQLAASRLESYGNPFPRTRPGLLGILGHTDTYLS